MKTLTLTETENSELLILVRTELQRLDEMGTFLQEKYEKYRMQRIDIMSSLLDKLQSEEA